MFTRPKAGLKQPPEMEPAVLIMARRVKAIAAALRMPSLLSSVRLSIWQMMHWQKKKVHQNSRRKTLPKPSKKRQPVF